jgi:hypothetical protein
MKSFNSVQEVMEWWLNNAQGKQIGVLLNGHKEL